MRHLKQNQIIIADKFNPKKGLKVSVGSAQPATALHSDTFLDLVYMQGLQWR